MLVVAYFRLSFTPRANGILPLNQVHFPHSHHFVSINSLSCWGFSEIASSGRQWVLFLATSQLQAGFLRCRWRLPSTPCPPKAKSWSPLPMDGIPWWTFGVSWWVGIL
jgi:hypothetical protein